MFQRHLLRFGVLLAVATAANARNSFDARLLEKGYEFRCIGPWRGGRSCAVSGVVGQPSVHYMGATGGGVFRTSDGGLNWESVSDEFFGGSIGAIAVAASDPNVIYVGGGEQTVRGNVSHGYGVFRSTDAGRTWSSIGLTDSRHVARIRIHPDNPDLVYVAALGHLFGPNAERGLFRSRDGGATWEKILFVDEETGCADLEMDPTNPRILYASFWRVRRMPHGFESGGEGSSFWKSVDGGDHWTEITRNEGLPGGIVGINALTVSPRNPDRVWAMVEAKDGGVFRSEDAGKTWKRVNESRDLRQRAWYYTRIYADPGDVDTVWVLNVSLWRSKDGGESFEDIDTPHGDHHDLWIDPLDSSHLIVGDDGGAQVSYDGGANWSTYQNQPTAQFYRVAVDNSFPYRIYGGQQDNSTVRIRHRSDGRSITEFDWEPTAGGESGWVAVDPRDNDIVYGGSYGGYLDRLDHRTGRTRMVDVWPDNPMGHGAATATERFQWNFPLLFSRHESGSLYAASQRLWVTRDEGVTWTAISGDLTRNDPTRMQPSGGPITKDNTSVEYYCTIFSLAEDCFEPGAIWVGSDDGLVHLTRDGGETWTNVTPQGLPEWIQINSLESDPHRAGGIYVAATSYKNDDFRPYLYRSDDWGKSWDKIVKGIDEEHFTRVLRADPARRGLLYAGTESGLYVSFDDGVQWSSLQLNLPITPITDLAVKENDLVVATQGRSFWVLDDLTVLHQWTPEIAAAEHHLFAPRPTWRMVGAGRGSISGHVGQNHPDGALIHYRFASKPDSQCIALRILDADGDVIRSYTPKAEEQRDRLPLEAGMSRLVWDLRYPDAEEFEGMVLWAGYLRGPRAVPGDYRVRLVNCADSTEVSFQLQQDPRSTASAAELQEQFDYAIRLRDEVTRVHRAIEELRRIRGLIQAAVDRAKGLSAHEALVEAQEPLLEKLKSIEEALYQTQNRSEQDPLNFPIRLNDKLAGLSGNVATGDYPPTASVHAVHAKLREAIDVQLRAWQSVLREDIPRFNALVSQHAVPAVPLPLDAAAAKEDGRVGNLLYRGTQSGSVLLTDGIWQGDPYNADGATRPEVSLASEAPVRGNLDADAADEAVVVLSEQAGGSGIFVYLALIDGLESEPQNAATLLLGDRIGVSRLDIVAGELVGELVVPGEGDAACCPSQMVRVSWRFSDGELQETSREAIGQIPKASLQ